MMEAEADLMNKEYGDRGVEPCNVVVSIRDKDVKKKRTRKKLIKLFFYGSFLFFMGMQTSQKGPAFLDLQLISGTGVKGASSYLTANNFGYMIGALVAGFLYDRIEMKVLLIIVPTTLASFLIALTPWCTSFVPMLLVHFAAATQCSIAETTVTVDQFPIWHGKSDAAFQFLSFMHSLGGVLGPLYTEPFLAPKWNQTDNKAHHIQAQEGNPKTNNVSNLMYNSLNSSMQFVPIEETSSNTDFEENLTNSFSNFEDPPESQLYYAYMITGLFGILCSIPFYVICCKNCSKSSQEEIKIKNDKPVNATHKRLTLTSYIVLTAITSIFFFFYLMTEDSFNSYVSMFVVSHLSWTKENGALISSLYWGISTISKLISVPLVRRFHIGIILLICCVGMVVSFIVFLLSSHYHIDILIWIATSFFGMSQSTIFGGGLCWVDTNLFKLDGKATSIIMVLSAAGSIVGPLVLGITIDEYSVMVFPHIELIISVMSTCIFMFMFFFLEPYVTRVYGPVIATPPKDIDIILNEQGFEMVEEKQKYAMTADGDDDDRFNDNDDDDDDDDVDDDDDDDDDDVDRHDVRCLHNL